MKHCPVCGKEYENSWGVCMRDDAKLSEGAKPSNFIPSEISDEQAPKTALIPYTKLYLVLAACVLGMYLMHFGIKRKYSETSNLIQSFFGYHGIMFLLLAVACSAIAYLIIKYRNTLR